MDHKYIEDHHVVARYLADQLSDADREAFEAFCQANPDVYREIEAAARFKVGLAKLDESKQLQPLLEAKSHSKPFLFRHAAAIAGLALGGALLYGAVTTLRVPVMGATVAEVSGRFREPLPVVGEYELLRTRAAEPVDPSVTLPVQRGVIRLHVLPDIEGADAYDAILRKFEGNGLTTIATYSGLTPDEEQFVSLYLRSEEFEAGKYEVAVVPSGDQVEGAGLQFDVVGAAASQPGGK